MSQPTDPVLASELDGFGVAFWSWNFEDGKVFFSAEWYRMRGFQESDRNLTLSSCESRVHREDLEKLQRCREELIRGERSAYEQDYRVRHQNGSWIWIAERARAKLDDNGNAVGLVACDIDITVRKLAEEGERLKEVLQATSDFIGIADKDFKCVWRNRCLNNLRPDTPEFAIENAHPEWAVRVQMEEALPHAIRHGSWSGESAVIDQAGNEIPVSQVVLAHKDARGEVEYFSTIMRDISQQKAAEQALKKSERMYASLAAVSPAAMIRLDAEGKQCSYVNPRWSEFFGQPSEAALGFGYCNFIHPEDWKACRPRFEEFVRDDSMTILEPQETRAIHADGSYRWVRVQFAKERDDAGNTTGYVGLISSIDDSKTAERELRKLHDRLQAVLKTSSIGIWEWSHAEGKLSWDNQMFEIYGLDPQEFKGDCTDWVERLHPEDAERVMRVDTGQQRFHGDSAMEFRILRPNGETRYIYSNVIIEQDENGDPIRTTGVNMDITDRRLTELALHKSQTQFERVVANVPGMIWQMESGDEGYEITYLSSKSREMFEVTPDEALADNCALRQYIHPDDLEPYLAGQRTAIANRTSFDLEFRIDLPEQGLRWRQCSAHPSVKEDGEVVWNGMTIDITDRKSAEIALQEAQERIQRITDHVPGMVYRYVVKPNRPVEFIYVGSESLAMFGVEPEELLKDGEKIEGWIHPEDFDELVIKRRDAKNAELQSIEYRVVTPDRGVRWYRSYCQPEFLDNGDVIWDGVVIDVTESKHIQLALQESQTQFERMTKNVPGMIYRYVRGADNSHWFTYVSQQVQEMYEIGPEVALADADKLFTVLHPDDVDRVQKATIESATALTPFVEEFRVRLPKQGLRWRKAVSQPSRTANGDVIWDGIVIDITDKKLTELRLKQANEELEHATKMKDVFLANMSHELRTPLSAILSTAEGLQMGLFGAPTKKQSESYEVICQSGTHLLNLIDEVLDLARIESGAIRLEFSSVELSTLCASCLKFVAGQAKLKSINLELNAVDLPTIEADEKRLRQILLNLLSNAIKFTPEGGKVTLEVHHLPDPSNEPNGEGREEAGDRIQFLVSDTGIGISASRLDSIFEPFVQIESTLSRNYEGSGLGLSLVKQFAELHRGQVYVTSKPGVGSCFTVELPCRISNANSRAAKTSDLVEARQHLDSFSVGNSALILVVEDNKLLAETTQNFLRAANFRVKIVSSGSLALESVEEERPDAILMDIQMPGMDGFEVIHRLRENPALARTPIIALTGLAMEGDARRCMEAGADYYLSKPYRIRELVGLIQRSLTSA